MNLNPIRISETLDKFAEYLESAEGLTPDERKKFAYRLDLINDDFEKAAAEEGLRTKNGNWLLGDGDESRYMNNFNDGSALMRDADEWYMADYSRQPGAGKWENSAGRETQTVSVREEPPIRDEQKDVNIPGEQWKNPHRDSSLPEGNVSYNKLSKKAVTIPKRKLS